MASSACLDPDTASAYVSGALSAEEHARVSQHIDECPTCRELVSLLAKSEWTTGVSGQTTLASPGRPPGPGPAAELLPRGTRVGSYEIRHPLSAGGMGVVYVGYDARLDRQVALKCVREHRGSTELLLNEAKLMAQAAHPNVVPVYDVIDAHGQVFIAMELVVGRNVAQWLVEAPHTWRQIVDVFLDAGAGLAAAHALGIIHGDVKPLNILIGHDGRVRVTDFGIATLQSTQLDSNALRGTPAYFAPEQKAGKQADAQSDQYAFAVSLHEALYGALPGAAQTKHTSVPLGVRRVLARGLAEAPGARYPSMGALLSSLRSARLLRWRQVAAGLGITATLVAAAFALGGRRAETEQCAAAASELESPWTAEAKERANAAFGRTGLSYAAQTLRRVEERLDAWSLAHASALKAACEPGWLSRDVPLLRFQSQLSCLKESTREARALVTQLGDADTAVVLHAVAMAEGLTPVARCTAAAAKPVVATAGGNPQVRDALARSKALAAAGKYREAVKVSQEAAKAADATDDLALRAAAKTVLGGQQTLVGEYDAAAQTLGEAIRLAELSGEDRVRAHAWTDLIGIEYTRSRHDQVLFLGAAVLGATQRVDDVRLSTEVMITVGSSLSEKGKTQEAKAMLEEAVKLRAEAYGANDRRTSMALSTLANVMAMSGDLDGAAAAHRRALAAAEDAFGAAHPEVGIIHMNLGDDYLYALKLEQAALELDHAEQIFLAANGPNTREALMAATDLGFALLLKGEREPALAAFERAVAGWAEAFPKHPSRAMALLGRYQAQGGKGDVKDLETAFGFISELPPFEAGRIQLELGLARQDAKQIAGAKENLSSVDMPLIAKELKRAQEWQAAK